MYHHFDFIASALIVIFAICVGIGFSYLECHSKAEKQGIECSWVIIQGCIVKMPDGSWMDYERLRYME